MKKLVATVVCGFAIVGLSACGTVAGSDGAGGHRLYVEDVPVNGTNVTCVVYDDQYHEQGGLSCDFQ